MIKSKNCEYVEDVRNLIDSFQNNGYNISNFFIQIVVSYNTFIVFYDARLEKK